MRAAGLTVVLSPSKGSKTLLRRGRIIDEEDFPTDPRYLQDGRTYSNYNRIDRWYPRIADLTIPTVFSDCLDAGAASSSGGTRMVTGLCEKLREVARRG